MTSFQRDTLLLRWPSFPRKHVLAEAGAGIHRLIQGALPDSAEIAGTPPSSAPRRGLMRYDGQRLGGEDVLLALNWPAYFDLLGQPPADGRDATLEALERDRLIAPCDAGGFNVTNLGAILLAKDLGDFPHLRRKALRIIEYRGRGRLETLLEREDTKGYAAGFAESMDYIHALLPTHEENGRAFQRAIPEFPPPAVRELVANALIHQDFSVTGARRSSRRRPVARGPCSSGASRWRTWTGPSACAPAICMPA